MAKGSRPRGTANVAGKPRPTALKGHLAQPAQKGTAKPSVLVKGSPGKTGTC